MKPRHFCLTEFAANELQAAFLHTRHAETKTRLQAVRLYGKGYSVEQIQEICACSIRSLLRWCQSYQSRGITALGDHRAGGNRSQLNPAQIEAVQLQLHTYTPAQLLGAEACWGEGHFWTVSDLARLLQRDYEVTYRSPSSYIDLLKRCGFSYQRPAKRYKTHSEQNKIEFEEQLEKKSLISLKPLPTR